MWGWKLNPGSLEEQPGFLASELSFQLQIVFCGFNFSTYQMGALDKISGLLIFFCTLGVQTEKGSREEIYEVFGCCVSILFSPGSLF